MRRTVAALGLVLVLVFGFGFGLLASSPQAPVSDLTYVLADQDDAYWKIVQDHGLSCTNTELWAANGRADLDPGTIVFVPPSCREPVEPPVTEVPTTEAPPSTEAPTTTVAPTTTEPPAPTTTVAPSAGFVSDFSTPAELDRFDVQIHHRSDHDATQNLPSNTWPGDHADNGDGTCTGPTEHRTLDALDGTTNTYWCDVGTGHFMTSMGDVDGYSTISFSPKQTFDTVSKVCWDQNVTDMGGRQWTEVVITPAADIPTFEGEPHLGHVNPEFEAVDQTSTPHGPGAFGAKFNSRYDGVRLYHDIGDGGYANLRHHNPYYAWPDAEGQGSTAIRRQHCLTDNGDGTVSLFVDLGSNNAPYETTVQGSFPADARVIFEDHNYTPDKDGQANGHYTWHWDNVTIEV